MGKRRPLRISGSDSNSSSKVHRNEETENASSRYQLNDNNMSNSDPDPEEDDEEDEEDNLFQQQTNELINMTFEFKDMKEMYCYDIAKMLEYLLPNHEARSIGEVVANQVEVGTVIVCEEGDDVFAYASIVPLLNILSQTSNFLELYEELMNSLSQLGFGEGHNELISSLSGANQEKTGIYFHGRYTNLPMQLIVPLHTNLKEDLQWIVSQSTSNSFSQLQYVIMFLPCSDDPSQQLKKGTCRNMTGSSSLLLSNFEDDIFVNHSICTIQIQFSKSPSPCCIALLALHEIDRCLEEIKQLVPP